MDNPNFRDECHCFAVRQAARRVSQMYERHMAAVGLKSSQFTILVKLRREPGMTMLTLAEAMVMDRTTLVRALKPLQRDGLVQSAPAPHDSRVLLLSLSSAGERKLVEARGAWSAAQAEYEQLVGAQRARALRAELFNLTAV